MFYINQSHFGSFRIANFLEEKDRRTHLECDLVTPSGRTKAGHLFEYYHPSVERIFIETQIMLFAEKKQFEQLTKTKHADNSRHNN